jgi:hypothetical protein
MNSDPTVRARDRGPVYRSDTPVSARVDIAWHRGYEAGKKGERERNLTLAGAALIVVWLWHHYRLHAHLCLLPWVIALSLILTVLLGPALVLFAVVRAVVRIYVRRSRESQPVVSPMAAAMDTGSDGPDNWPPF